MAAFGFGRMSFNVSCNHSAFVLFMLVLCTIVYHVTSLAFTTEVKIRAKIKTVSGCIDYSGVNRSHSESWPSAAGQCDKNICYFSQSVGIWVIEERCRQIDVWENPDPDNCRPVSDSGAAFPACCSALQCDSSPPLTTLPPNYCYDKGSAASCWFWTSVPDPCVLSGKYYNFTKEYCQKSCGKVIAHHQNVVNCQKASCRQ